MGDVHKLDFAVVGEGFRFEPDDLLEAAKGQGFSELMIIGFAGDGSLWTSGSGTLGEALVLIERAKHALIFGEG